MTRLIDQLNNSHFIFYFLVVDNFLDISLPELKNFHLIYASKNQNLKSLKKNNLPYFCLEEQGIKLDTKNSGKLLSHKLVAEYIKKTSHASKLTPAIIPFKPSAKIDHLCRLHKWTLVSNPSKVNRQLEDKIKFPQICQQFNIPVLPFSIGKLTQKNFQKHQQLFGPDLVVQTHFGWAGNSTHYANTFSKISKLIPTDTLVKFSPLMEGYTLINNCCQTHLGLIQSPPGFQLTGIKSLTQNPFATVGRQWPSTAPPNIQKQVREITNQFSTLLSKYKYRGFFGLDFFVSKDQVYLLECNPRLTASFSFYTQLEKNAKITPLFYYHLAEFISQNYKFNYTLQKYRFNNTSIVGTELTPKNKNNVTIQKIHIPSTVHSVQNIPNLSINLP